MFVPSVVTIAIQATRIRASITAYSTAVGPSSLTRNREIDGRMRAIVFQLQEKSGEKAELSALHPTIRTSDPSFLRISILLSDTDVWMGCGNGMTSAGTRSGGFSIPATRSYRA